MRFLIRLKDNKGKCVKAEIVNKPSSIEAINDYDYDPKTQTILISKVENARTEVSEF